MSNKHSETPEPPNNRIGWSIYMLSLAVTCLVCGLLAPFRIFPFLTGGRWFFAAIGLGCLLAFVVNSFRPRYESAAGNWKKFYDFLLKQLPPPD